MLKDFSLAQHQWVSFYRWPWASGTVFREGTSHNMSYECCLLSRRLGSIYSGGELENEREVYSGKLDVGYFPSIRYRNQNRDYAIAVCNSTLHSKLKSRFSGHPEYHVPHVEVKSTHELSEKHTREALEETDFPFFLMEHQVVVGWKQMLSPKKTWMEL